MKIQTAQNVHKSLKKIKKLNIYKPKESSLNVNMNKSKTMVVFGHENWNLVVNMMMGVRMSVKSV